MDAEDLAQEALRRDPSSSWRRGCVDGTGKRALAFAGAASIAAVVGAGLLLTVLPQHDQNPATGSTTPAPSTKASSNTPTTPALVSAKPCRSAQLRGHVRLGGGAMGTYYADLVLTNISSTACSMHGYPDVSFVAYGNGTQVGETAAHERFYPSQAVQPCRGRWEGDDPPGNGGGRELPKKALRAGDRRRVPSRCAWIRDRALRSADLPHGRLHTQQRTPAVQRSSHPYRTEVVRGAHW
jgi:Protein of unknown function (DUF4232)